MLLYKTTFQHQGLEFAVCDNIFKILYTGDHPAYFVIVVLFTPEILAHTIFKGFGLAYINNFTGCIVHNIHSRQQGKLHCLCAQSFDALISVFHCVSPFDTSKAHRTFYLKSPPTYFERKLRIDTKKRPASITGRRFTRYVQIR